MCSEGKGRDARRCGNHFTYQSSGYYRGRHTGRSLVGLNHVIIFEFIMLVRAALFMRV